MFTSLRARLALVYVACVAVPFIAIALWMDRDLDRMAARRIQGSVRERGETFAWALERTISLWQDDLRRLGGQLSADPGSQLVRQTLRDRGDPGRWQEVLTLIDPRPRPERVRIFDPGSGQMAVILIATNGAVAVQSSTGTAVVPDDQVEIWRQRAAEGPAWRRMVSGAGTLEIGVAVPGPDAWLLLADLSWSSLATASGGDLLRDDRFAFFVADAELGRYFYHSRRERAGDAISAREFARVEAPLLWLDRLPGGAVTIGVQRLDTSVAAETGPMKRGLGLMVAVALLAGGLLMMLLAGRVRARLMLLRRAADAYAGGDFNHRIAPIDGGELGDLARAVNAMAGRLGDLRDDIEIAARQDLLRRLQSRVRRDTSDVRLGLDELARSLEAPDTPRVVLRGAGHVLRRLSGRLHRVERETLNGGPVGPGSRDPDDIDLDEVDLAREIRTCVQALVPLDRSDIRVQLVMPETLPCPRLPVGLMPWILGAVLDNALRAMPEGGILKVEVVSESHRVSVHVIDTGIGMTASFLRRRLFKPFSSAWADGQGFGLSLHRSREALRGCGGDIEVSSREGVGTRVTLRFPLECRHGADLAADAANPGIDAESPSGS